MTIYSSNPSSIPSNTGAWATTTNVYTSNDTYATNTGATQNTEYAFEAGGFNFAAIPAATPVNSVTVTIEAKTGTANRAQIKGELLDGTTVLGTRALTNLTAADANYTFTATATLAQIQSANLKVRITNKRTVSQASTTSVDWVKIDVDAGLGGRPKAWTGSAWAAKPGKVWTGSAWVEKTWKTWDGSQWKVVK